jgi:hypothetical protein
MPEVNAIPKKGVRISDFLSMKVDLEFLLKQFPAQKLAEWLSMDKGNLSRKINGVDKITDRFIHNFNKIMEYPILLLHQGKTPQEVEDQMDLRLKKETPDAGKMRFSLFEQSVGKVLDGVLEMRDMVLEVQVTVLEEKEKNEREIGGIKIVLRQHDLAIEALNKVAFGS